MPSAVNQVGRLLWKYNQWPSVVRLGVASLKALFTIGPRLNGGSQQSSRLSRSVTQRSTPPEPPGRFDWKMRLKPSLEMVGWLSSEAELTTAGQGVPSLSVRALRLTGADQAENCCAAARCGKNKHTSKPTNARKEPVHRRSFVIIVSPVFARFLRKQVDLRATGGMKQSRGNL